MNPRYVDTTTNPPVITTLAALLRKSPKIGNPNAIPSQEMLTELGGALLDESATGEVATQEAFFNTDTQTYQQVYTTRTAEERLAIALTHAKAECERRIYAVASDNAQKNMTAARADGDMTAEQLTNYSLARQWVKDMQAAVGVIATGGLDPNDDANWPFIPVGVPELVAQF